MKKDIIRYILDGLKVSVALMVICGLIYPLVMTGVSSILFPSQANGNLVYVNDKVVGVKNVGQEFSEDYFMKTRPSAYHYNTYVEKDGGNYYLDGSEFAGIGSGSSNYAASNPALLERINNDVENFLKDNPGVTKEELPVDLFTQSGSGLDPHISVESAMIQIPSIAKASGISEDELVKIVENNTNHKVLGVLGEDTVNVLMVNIDIAKTIGLL